MKEATGELNMTVIVVLIVAILSAFFYTVIWPMMKNNQNNIANCNAAKCDKCLPTDSTTTCYLYDRDGVLLAPTGGFQCVCKG